VRGLAGGGLLSQGAVTLLNTVFSGNVAGAAGGAVDVSQSIVVSNSLFTGNYAPGNGGAINVRNSSHAGINNSRFEGNISGNWGGVMYATGPLTMENTQVISNSAVQWGGAVFVLGRTTISNTTFERNHSDKLYGAMLVFDSAHIAGSNFISNSAVTRTGGLRVTEDAHISDSVFKGNGVSTGYGGGLEVNGSLGITRSRFIDNNAVTYGGGLLHSGDGFSVVNSLFARNSAGDGGAAIHLTGSGTHNIRHTTVVAPAQPLTTGVYITTTGTVSVVNSIFDGYSYGLEIAAGSVSENYNLYDQSGISGTVSRGGRSITGAPQYVNPANDDYHHASGSWAINTGVTTDISTDIDGNSRPGGGNTDIGFDETAYVTDVAISKSVVVSAAPGAPLTYTIIVSNVGGSMLRGIVFTDTLPGVVVDTAVLSGGVAITQVAGAPEYVWQTGEISPSRQAIITMTGRFTEPLHRGPYTNTVTVTFTLPPPPEQSTTNNSDAVMILVPNFAPVTYDDVFTTPEDTAAVLLPLANDTDGEPLAIDGVGALPTSTVLISDAIRLVYTPTLNFYGTEVFTYGAGDDLLTTTGTITVVVTPVNDAPVISGTDPLTVTMSEDSDPIPFDLTLYAEDVDGDPLTWTLTSLPLNGTAAITAGPAPTTTVAYTPTTHYTGTDHFEVEVTDGLLTDTVTVSVSVEPRNDPPVGVDDFYMVLNQNNSDNISLLSDSPAVTLPVLANDTDVENDPLSVLAVGEPNQGGKAGIGPGGAWLVYTPTTTFTGTEIVTYTVTDGDLSDTATVTLSVVTGDQGAGSGVVFTAHNSSSQGTMTVTVEIPTAAGNGHLSVVYEQLAAIQSVDPPFGRVKAGAPFRLIAYLDGKQLNAGTAFSLPLTMTLEYTNTETANRPPAGGGLTLYRNLGGSDWSNAGVGIVASDLLQQRQVLTVAQPGDYCIFRLAPHYFPIIFADREE
jgi:uncharacterized repeat protein (TIGR01451 family)